MTPSEIRANRYTVDCTEPVLTEQCGKQQCDLNYIVRKHQTTGLLEHVNTHQGRYDDVSAPDYQSALYQVATVNSMFEALPSNIRAQFSNRPEKFLHFTQDPINRPQLIEMGILPGNDGLDASGAPSGAPVADIPAEPVPVPPAPAPDPPASV